MFAVGQKVECINDTNGEHTSNYGAGFNYGLRRGAIYTVAHGEDSYGIIVLAEVDGGWFKDRFRPVVERKTDISIFTAMLTPKTENADA